MFNKNNITNLMKQAQKMQENMTKMQKEIAMMKVVGESGAGLVKITMNGTHDCQKIEIDESMMIKDNKEMLEDLIIAAFNDASRRISEEQKQKMSDISTKIPFQNETDKII